MNKKEFIAKYGEDAYEKKLERTRAYYKEHRGEIKARVKNYREAHLEEVKAVNKKYRDTHSEQARERAKKWKETHLEQVISNHQKEYRKGGTLCDKHLEYERIGLRGERNKVRHRHRYQYSPYKQIIAPDSQLHHEWIPETAEYRGVALVEAEPHQYGIIDVIQILDGKITLITEEEVKRGTKNGT